MGTQQQAIGCITEPSGVSSIWITRPYILVFCFAPAAVIALLLWSSGSDPGILLGHVGLAIGTFVALWILSKRPLIDPIQGFVFFFHFWFAVGPAICGTFYLATDQPEQAQPFLTGTSTALLIVACGLFLYASAAISVLNVWPMRWSATFLRPEGRLYRPRTIGMVIAISLICSGVLELGELLGVHAFDDVNYLGGKMTSSPVMAVIAAVGRISTIATLGLIGYLAAPGWRKRLLPLSILVITWLPSILSGMKSAIMLTIFYLVVARFAMRQRLSLLLILGSVILYLGLIEPFVAKARIVCQLRGAYNSDQRRQIFEEVLTTGEFFRTSWKEVFIESPFRGIYQLAQKTADLSSFTEGPWQGESIRTGMLTVIPRVFYPDKPDMNIGHYFAVKLSAPGYEYESQNVALTVPFEVVGNYGWLIGVFSFVLIGVVWTALTVWMLSPGRLATHPLMPWLLAVAMTFEDGIGPFINGIKDVPIALLVVAGIWLCNNRRL